MQVLQAFVAPTCINAISEYPCPCAQGSSDQSVAEGLLDFRGQGKAFWAPLDYH